MSFIPGPNCHIQFQQFIFRGCWYKHLLFTSQHTHSTQTLFARAILPRKGLFLEHPKQTQPSDSPPLHRGAVPIPAETSGSEGTRSRPDAREPPPALPLAEHLPATPPRLTQHLQYSAKQKIHPNSTLVKPSHGFLSKRSPARPQGMSSFFPAGLGDPWIQGGN